MYAFPGRKPRKTLCFFWYFRQRGNNEVISLSQYVKILCIVNQR
jgi:hypothetical protein